MKKIRDHKNKVIEVQLDKGDQLLLIKTNLKLLRQQTVSTVMEQKYAKVSQ